MKRKSLIKSLLVCSVWLVSVSMAGAQVLNESSPRLFLTKKDITRAKEQVSNPKFLASIELAKKECNKSITAWRKFLPSKTDKYTMEELFEVAKNIKASPLYSNDAIGMALFPSNDIAQVVREKILVETALHKNQGSWRELGIHEGERLERFLSAYDLVAETGLFSAYEKQAIKQEIHQSARFLESWALESDLNEVTQGQTYCFNINYFPVCMMGVVALYYPDFEESPKWLQKAQDEVPRYFYTENFLDGAYSEGSMNYWTCTLNGLTHYILADKNLGKKDYINDPCFRTAYKNSMYWRANLTAPDGRKSAIGDAHHENKGVEFVEIGAQLLKDPELLWMARNSIELISDGVIRPNDEPNQILFEDLSLPLKKPSKLYANYIWSGYGTYRSDWSSNANYFFMKYGPTFGGRREIEKYPVIPGHAHEDCMEIEMFYKGIPMFIDGGNRGYYKDYDDYGGYIKATIAHSTVGLGNKWGYKRNDGKFAEHQKQHGMEFRYEKEQNNISRQTTRLKAFGDVDDCVLLSAKAQTYDDVTHQRSVLWFRNSSLMVVHDKLNSEKEHNYEWYLNPIGKNLSQNGKYTFGDEKANLDVIQIGEKQTEIIGKGTPGIPKYYIGFREDLKKESAWDGENARWVNYSLMTETATSKDADFLNILLPYEKVNPFTVSNLSKNGKQLKSDNEEILVSTKCDDKKLTVDGLVGIVRSTDKVLDYSLESGYELKRNGELLLKSELNSLPWKSFYDNAVTAVVGLDSKRATFVLNPNPWDEHLMLYNPKLEEGKEPALPIEVKVTFKVNEKPNRIVKVRSADKQAELENATFKDKVAKGNFFTGKKNYANVEPRFARQELKFDYDEKKHLVSVILHEGFNQLVWE